jgi:putative glycosyltransferase (TIGR04348 family)
VRRDRLKIRLVTPAPRGARTGNRVTAERWAAILRQLGHSVSVGTDYRGDRCHLLVAVHARKSHKAIEDYRARVPGGRIVVLLAGTDLYQDGPANSQVRESMEHAARLVVLQPLARRSVPRRLRRKVRIILQSLSRPNLTALRRADGFDVCVLGHLRAVKDPLRAAYAARRLPASSRVHIVHIGGALSRVMERRARIESRRNPRYEWVGDRSHGEALRMLARSRLLVLSSRTEGGANAISEAIVCGVPVVATKIDGSVGLLGSDYRGYFGVGDTAALAQLLHRAELDQDFLTALRAHCKSLAPMFDPRRERKAWRDLLAEL